MKTPLILKLFGWIVGVAAWNWAMLLFGVTSPAILTVTFVAVTVVAFAL